MENQQIIVPTSNVEGNITNCKIENQVLRVDRKNVLSLTEKTTYITYDVCNKEVLSEYTVPEITGTCFIGFLGIVILLFFVSVALSLTKY